MKIGRIIWAAAMMGAVLGVPIVFAPAIERAAGGVNRVVVLTSHNEQIRHETGTAFREWFARRHGGSPVHVEWRAISGSSEMASLLRSRYSVLAAEGREDDGAGYDLAFGGGEYLFDKQLKKGVSATDGAGATRQVSITAPIAFEPEFVAAAFPDVELAGRPLYDREGHWWGAALSGFGIVYNRDVVAFLGLTEPVRWEDLADPAYFNWLAIADPSHSSSARVTYETILQRYGFERGWRTLRRICANARYFSEGAAQVPTDVSLGEVAAGACVDFLGRYQSEAVGQDRLRFVFPPGETTVNADPIALLRGAPNRETAIEFVRFVLSREGQGLLNFKVGVEFGPSRFALRRSPVRRDLYEKYPERMADDADPFAVAEALPPDTPGYFDVLAVVMRAFSIDVHEEQRAAWRCIAATSDPAERARLEALFDALPFDGKSLQEAAKRWRADPQGKESDRLEWTAFFRAQYRKVLLTVG